MGKRKLKNFQSKLTKGGKRISFKIPVKKRKTITKSELNKLNKARKGKVQNARPLSVKTFEKRSKGIKIVSD